MASDGYALGRGYVEATRLQCQHYLWKETLGYLIHPSIPLEGKDLKIADVGTGTGAWLLDLAKDLPSSIQLDGFDISASGYPQVEWLPQNVSLQALDASKEPPEHLVGKYDIVHLRLFLIVVNENDPKPFLNHCMRLLKPGGWLQWEEYDQNTQKIVTSNASASTVNLTAMSEFIKVQKPFDWVAALPQTFRDQNFTHVDAYRLHEHRWHTRMWMEMELVLAEEYSRNVLDVKGPPGSGDKLRQLAKAVYAEVRQGGSIEKTLQIVVGRTSV
ncbi:MAG: hypothetical protein ASARMPREDX12_000249 [Alectoria sarmentosa]|nr:MAG: hypothetical protein ASARMPREDX12_000249 [Alectoria sarmentosa]